MTVGELKKELEKYPDTMDVFLARRITDYAYGLANSVRIQEIHFEPNDDWENEDEIVRENAVVIDED